MLSSAFAFISAPLFALLLSRCSLAFVGHQLMMGFSPVHYSLFTILLPLPLLFPLFMSGQKNAYSFACSSSYYFFFLPALRFYLCFILLALTTFFCCCCSCYLFLMSLLFASHFFLRAVSQIVNDYGAWLTIRL